MNDPNHYSHYSTKPPGLDPPVFADPMINRLHQQTFDPSFHQQQQMPDQQGHGRGQFRPSFMNVPLPTRMIGDGYMNYPYSPQYELREDNRLYEDGHMGHPNMRQRQRPDVWGKGLHQNINNSYGPAGQGGKQSTNRYIHTLIEFYNSITIT